MVHSFVIPLLVFGAYMLGAIPFGVLVAKRRGVDIRAQGSGNTGATNVARVIGLGPGLLVLALDAAKGALAVIAVRYYVGVPQVVALAGWAAIAGHCFSPFLGGRGGKGVATALGVLLTLYWPAALCAAATWLAVAVVTRISSLSALITCVAAPGYMLLFGQPEYAAVTAVIALLVIAMHHANIRRLLGGTEPRIGAKGKR